MLTIRPASICPLTAGGDAAVGFSTDALSSPVFLHFGPYRLNVVTYRLKGVFPSKCWTVCKQLFPESSRDLVKMHRPARESRHGYFVFPH